MGNKKTFRDLIVWRKSIDLAKAVYQATQKMPSIERFGLVAQMRRAAVSIASNSAEGNARQTLGDYIHFLVIARGSLAELETQITIAGELKMLKESPDLIELLAETDRLLQALIRQIFGQNGDEGRCQCTPGDQGEQELGPLDGGREGIVLIPGPKAPEDRQIAHDSQRLVGRHGNDHYERVEGQSSVSHRG